MTKPLNAIDALVKRQVDKDMENKQEGTNERELRTFLYFMTFKHMSVKQQESLEKEAQNHLNNKNYTILDLYNDYCIIVSYNPFLENEEIDE